MKLVTVTMQADVDGETVEYRETMEDGGPFLVELEAMALRFRRMVQAHKRGRAA